MRHRQWVLPGAGLAVLAAGLWLAVPEERIAALASAELQRLTGRSLVAASSGVRLFPAPGLAMYDVVVQGPGGELARADRVVLTVGLATLAGGDTRITGIEIDGLQAIAGRDSNGRELWTLAQGVEGGAVAPALALRRVVLRDAAFDWADAQAGWGYAATGLDAEIAGGRIVASAVLNGLPATLDGEVSDTAALWSVGTAARGTLRLGPSEVQFDGRVGMAPRFAEGAVSADLAGLPALAGFGPADVPAGLGRDLRRARGNVTLTPQGSWHLRDGAVELDGNLLSVAADVTFEGPRPRIAAQVNGTRADIVLAGAHPALPVVRLLRAADAAVGVQIGEVTLDGRTMGPLRAEVRVDNARAEADLREVGLFGGRVSGDVVVNARSGLSLAGDVAAAGVDLAAASAAWGLDAAVGGQVDLRLSLTASGTSAAELVASLAGEGRAGVVAGALPAADLGALFLAQDPAVAAGSTTIDLASASFTLQGGVIETGDLRVEASDIALAGTARIGLAAQTLDVEVTPVRQATSGAPHVPLRIAGSWADPVLAFDLGVVAARALADERAGAPAGVAEPVDIVPLSGVRSD